MAMMKRLSFPDKLKFLLIGILLIGFQEGRAQDLPTQPDTLVESYYLDTGQIASGTDLHVNQGKIKLSPVAKGAAIIAVGAGIWTATFALADEPVRQYAQSHRTTTADKISYVVQPLGRQGYMVPVAGVALAGGLLMKDAKLQKVALVSMGSILISSGVTSVMKNQFHRYRPNSTTENHVFDGPIRASDNTSLPSAHTATAFAVATSVATVYGYEYRYVPPIAYGVATLVGLSRINDNAHWATDVMAGAVVGYISAKGAVYLYEMANHKLSIRKQRLLITPQLGTKSGGVSATLVF